MAARKSGAVTFTAFTQDDYKVHVSDGTAIVTGRMTIRGRRDGKDYSGQERFTDVFVLIEHVGWQAVTSHASRVAKP
jgi:ketosteroid isomerase-like protein